VKRSVIADTGPLVALVNRRDQYHAWAVEQVREFAAPMLTCEAVLSEALFLVGPLAHGAAQILGLLRSGGLRVAFSFDAEKERVCDLLLKYASLPMSLADACLVRMSELFPEHRVFTLDTDFRIYRRHRNRTVPVVLPEPDGGSPEA
jgi:predicted nucleic acid-binding protein